MREQIIEFASQSPEFGQGIDIIEERLSRTAMVPEDLDEAIEMLEAALTDYRIEAWPKAMLAVA